MIAMKSIVYGAAVVALAAGWAAAGPRGIDGVQTSSAEVSYVFGNELPMPTFAPFDDMGGTRRLESVAVSMAAQISSEIAFVNNDGVGYTPDDWFSFVTVGTLFQVDGPEKGSGAFFGLGGLDFGKVTAFLAASDGVPGGEDTFVVSGSGFVDSTVEAGPDLFSVFEQSGPLTTVFGPFTDIFTSQPTGGGPFLGFPGASGITAEVLSESIIGTLTFTYGYSIVPTPSGVALAGLAGVGVVRRRRR